MSDLTSKAIVGEYRIVEEKIGLPAKVEFFDALAEAIPAIPSVVDPLLTEFLRREVNDTVNNPNLCLSELKALRQTIEVDPEHIEEPTLELISDLRHKPRIAHSGNKIAIDVDAAIKSEAQNIAGLIADKRPDLASKVLNEPERIQRMTDRLRSLSSKKVDTAPSA